MNIDISNKSMSLEQIQKYLFEHNNHSITYNDYPKYIQLLDLLKSYPITNHKICLIRPHQIYPKYINKYHAANKLYIIYIPYGIMSLTASIKMFLPHWKVEITDLHLESIRGVHINDNYNYESLLNTIPHDCDVYGISYMFPTATTMVLDIADYLKSKGKFVIAGGVQATSDYVELLNTNKFDIILKKESETQIIRLLYLWEESHKNLPEPTYKYSGLVNTSYKHNNQIISFNDVFEDIISIDIKETYDYIDIDEIYKYGSTGVWGRSVGKNRKYSNIMINRGCRGNCTFCSVSHFMKRGIRPRKPKDVLNEILFLYYKKGVRHIEWLDDDLLGSRKNALYLFNKLASLNLDLKWSTSHFVLASSIDREMALAMSNSGCVMTGFGVETGNAKRLKETGKLVTHKHIRNAVSIFRTYHPHIYLMSSFIFGFPNETFAELFETFNFAKELKLDWCGNSLLLPFRGTKIYEQFKQSKHEPFVKKGTQVYTIGREIVSKGKTFDDIFDEIIDFRKVNLSSVATKNELQQFQIYFNVFVNQLGNINLTGEGNPEKIRSHTAEVVKAYPMDAISWYVNAIASKSLHLIEQYDISMKNCENALKESSFWRNFFYLYNVFDYKFTN